MAIVVDFKKTRTRHVKNLRWLLEKKREIERLTFFSFPDVEFIRDGFLIAYIDKQVFVSTWADFRCAEHLIAHPSFSHIPVTWK